MTLIIAGSRVPHQPLQASGPTAKKNAANISWSTADYLKWMVLSVLSQAPVARISKWARTQLSDLEAGYRRALGAHVMKGVQEAQARLRAMGDNVVRLANYADRTDAFNPILRTAIFNGFGFMEAQKEAAIDMLVKDDTLWPSGTPTVEELKTYVQRQSEDAQESRKTMLFVAECRARLDARKDEMAVNLDQITISDSDEDLP